MVHAILSDIHANFEALERVLADARSSGAEDFVCLGDVVGYGPLPAKTLACVRATCSIVLAGNHDDAVAGRSDASDFIDLAGDAVSRHRAALSPEELDYLSKLPYAASVGEALAAHGSPADPKAFPYVDCNDAAADAFAATDVRLVFVGHTHVPAFYLTGGSGKIYLMSACDFTLEDGKRYIVNPGSVGYPREKDGVCHSSYVLYDDKAHTIRYRFLPFSVASVMQRGAVTPSRHPKPFLLWTAVGILLALAAAVAVLVSRPSAKSPAVPQASPLSILTNQTLILSKGVQTITPNLTVADGPILLEILFRDKRGMRIDGWTQTVKTSNKIPRKVPKGATEASITVRNPNPEKSPHLTRFAPSVK